MPWQLRKTVLLILLGVAALVLGSIVLVLNRDASSDLLAVVAIVGGLAIIVNSLPVNGRDQGGGGTTTGS
jgi:hypothetical protein